MSQQSFHFHGPVTIHVHDGQTAIAAAATATGAAAVSVEGTEQARAAEVLLEKAQAFDPDYDHRPGYDADFLGVSIPIPEVHAERRREMLTTFGGRPLVLDYHHYSLAMNKKRRFAMWTAANVDYSEEMRGTEVRKDFGDEAWRSDERVPGRFQVLDGDFYVPARRIDRGHLVRREDTVWGRTARERAFANADTYHWTNCTPQHERFNRSQFKGAWGELENQVKAEAMSSGAKLSVFAGPILDDSDPEALGVQYPLRFWKVIAAVEEGELRAYGFVLDQSRVVGRHGLGVVKELDFSAFGEQQMSLQEVEGLSGVAFPRGLHEADVLAGQAPVEIKRATDVRRRRR